MLYLLTLTLIEPGTKIIGESKQQIFMMFSPEDAAIICYKNMKDLLVGLDMSIRFYEVDFNRLLLKEISVPKLEFKKE